MVGHLSDSQIEQYRRGSSATSDLIAANEHLADCAECFRRFNPAPDVHRLYKSMLKALAEDETPVSDHLEYEELAGVVNGVLNGDTADRCEVHIEQCEECRRDVEWLREFRLVAVTQNRQAAENARVVGEKSIGQAEASHEKPTLESSGVTLSRRWLTGYRLAALAASVLLVFTAVVWLFSSGLRRERAFFLRAQVDQLRSDSEALRQSAAEIESLRNEVAELKSQIGPDNGSGTSVGGASGPGPADGSSAIVALNDAGRPVQLYKDGTVRGIESTPADYQDLVGKALASERIQIKPIHTTGIGKQGPVLGEQDRSAGFKVLQPATTSVESARPAFTWTEQAGASSYTVFLKDLESGIEGSSGPLAGTKWAPGADLVRGHTYAWMVEANKDGKLVRAPGRNKPFAQFKVIAANEFDEVQKARAEWGNSHLVMAVVYGKAGLREEAERELKRLADANPDSKAAEKLYRSAKGK